MAHYWGRWQWLWRLWFGLNLLLNLWSVLRSRDLVATMRHWQVHLGLLFRRLGAARLCYWLKGALLLLFVKLYLLRVFIHSFMLCHILLHGSVTKGGILSKP